MVLSACRVVPAWILLSLLASGVHAAVPIGKPAPGSISVATNASHSASIGQDTRTVTEKPIDRAREVFTAPAAYVVSKAQFWRDDWPQFEGYGLAFALLFSWFVWLTAARMAWCITGRAFGFYNPETFNSWLSLWIPWRWFYFNTWLRLAIWREEVFQHGKIATARLAGPVERMAHVYKPGYIFLGRLRVAGVRLLQPVGLSGKTGKHLIMIAGTGSGKTTHLISMLGVHEGNAFVIDPKAQIAAAIARRLAEGSDGITGKGRKVRIVDPSRQLKGHDDLRARWNPFEELHRAKERAIAAGHNPDNAVVSFALKFAEGLIVRYAKENPFWAGTSKEFLHAVILHIHVAEPRERQTLERLYQLVTVGLPEFVKDPSKETGFDALLKLLVRNPAFGGAIASGATALMTGARETVGSVTMTFREQLKWLKLPAMRECSSASDFYLDELKTGNLALFVCAKLSEVREDFPGWFRLLTVMALATFEDIKGNLANPCLFALDEFASLGKLDRVETAAPYMRSFGVRLLVIIQNIGQIAGGNGAPPLYDNWETFIGNSECCWWMATSHRDNLEYLEKKLGKRTIKTKVASWTGGPQRIDYKEREVMTADQIERFLARGNSIVTRGSRAFTVAQEPYFKALPVSFYNADREHKEPAGRAMMRAIFQAADAFGPWCERLANHVAVRLRPLFFTKDDQDGQPLIPVAMVVVAAFAWAFTFGSFATLAEKPDWIDWLFSIAIGSAAAIVLVVTVLSFFIMPLLSAWHTLIRQREGTFSEHPFSWGLLALAAMAATLAVLLRMAGIWLFEHAYNPVTTGGAAFIAFGDARYFDMAVQAALCLVQALSLLPVLVMLLIATIPLPMLVIGLTGGVLMYRFGLVALPPAYWLAVKFLRVFGKVATWLPETNWLRRAVTRWKAAGEEATASAAPQHPNNGEGQS